MFVLQEFRGVPEDFVSGGERDGRAKFICWVSMFKCVSSNGAEHGTARGTAHLASRAYICKCAMRATLKPPNSCIHVA